MRTLLPFLSFLLLGFISCEDAFTTVIDADPPPFTRKMVVHSYCEDTPDTPQKLYLETNRNIFDAQDQNLPITDATIEVFEDGQLVGQFVHDASPAENEYVTSQNNLFSKIGAEYTIQIKAPGMPDAEARQFLPAPVVISDALYVEDLAVDEDGDRVNGFKITFTDLPEEGNYYMLECFDTLNPDYRLNLESTDPYIRPLGDGFVLISDAGNNGFNQTFEMHAYQADAIRDYEFTLYHISKDLYQYLLSIDKHVNNDIDFFSEPTFVSSNIANGLGIFSLSSKTKKNVRK